jgi:CubicO group peptidase (beta-lactamase class C family)
MNVVIRGIVATAALAASLLASGAAAQPSAGRDRCAGLAEERRDIETFIQRVHALAYAGTKAPGFAVGVVVGDCQLLVKGVGYADQERGRTISPDTLFYIASTTKPFVALQAALLERRQRIQLDAPIGRYLPALRLHAPLDPNAITLRSLLTHQHGISNPGPVFFRTALSGQHRPNQLIRLMAKHKPAAYGTAFGYTNIGYNLVGFALDRTLGGSWKDDLTSSVLQPAGMRRTSPYFSRAKATLLAQPYSFDGAGYSRLHYAKNDTNMHAAGGLLSSAADLSKFLEIQIDAGRLDGRQVFPSSVIAATHRSMVSQRAEAGAFSKHGYGLGWDLATYAGEEVIQHNGGFSAFNAQLSFMPKRQFGVVVMANEAAMGGGAAAAVVEYVYDRLLKRPGLTEKWNSRLTQLPDIIAGTKQRIAAERTRRAARPKVMNRPLAAYAGNFENEDWGRITTQLEGGRLILTLGALRSEAEVQDPGKEMMRVELIPPRGEEVSFEFEGSRATSVRYSGVVFRRVS